MPPNLQPIIMGPTLLLRPLLPKDFEALFAVASDPLIWEQHPDFNRHEREIFRAFFEGAIASGGAFLIIDRETDRVVGSSRYYDHDAAKNEIAIGYTFLAREFWGGMTNLELKKMMLDHAFTFVDSVIFHVGELNVRSRKAVEKIGGKREATTQKTMPDGSVRKTVVYRLYPSDWVLNEKK